jgi:Flp pilus assembly pilin Flp
MFDFTVFFEASGKSGPLVVLIVLGLVTYLGKLGVKGRWQLISGMLIGLIFGGAFTIAALGLPSTFSGWFSTVMYGLMLGLVASGIYETGKEVVTKVATRILGYDDPLTKG